MRTGTGTRFVRLTHHNAGAVLLVLLRVITANEAYGGLRPEVLMLISGMVVLGIALEETGLAGSATTLLIGSMDGMSPLLALIILYGTTLIATEIVSNATVAVLFTPIAVSTAEAFAVSPRPFLVAVMIAGSAAFATSFGYQTNVIVYQMGGYNYLDFVKIGIPLNIITWVVGLSRSKCIFRSSCRTQTILAIGRDELRARFFRTIAGRAATRPPAILFGRRTWNERHTAPFEKA